MYTLMNNDRNIIGVTHRFSVKVMFFANPLTLVFNSVFTLISYSSYNIKIKLTTEAAAKQKTVSYLCQQVVEQKL